MVAQFKVKRDAASEKLFVGADEAVEAVGFGEAPDTYVLAWTTTPWTLPANTALAVGKNIPYVLVRTFNPYTYAPIQVVLAKALFNRYFPPLKPDVSFPGLDPHLIDLWLEKGENWFESPIDKNGGLEFLLRKKGLLNKVVAEFTGADPQSVSTMSASSVLKLVSPISKARSGLSASSTATS